MPRVGSIVGGRTEVEIIGPDMFITAGCGFLGSGKVVSIGQGKAPLLTERGQLFQLLGTKRLGPDQEGMVGPAGDQVDHAVKLPTFVEIVDPPEKGK